ncbi:hypothetical protein DFQ27_007077 [Actinomortierella ambigua]|uniref:Uncharacterized protein n=1 Tax=Actinomortierella ambigua TaxID=1343610 RepID=A0A9P6PXI7_9FUNG|nr:hypothetical protein DFQ27_007077 [Actinomortierella ambigua]
MPTPYSYRHRHRNASFDTVLYKKLLELQQEEQKQKQLRQHRIWQHVQDRVARQQQLLDEEEAEATKAAAAAAGATTTTAAEATPSTASSTTSKDTNAAVQALFADLNAEFAAPTASMTAANANGSSKASSKVPALKDPSAFQKHKRSIRWGLQNNTVRRFDKDIPLKDVRLPPVDRRPTKSALKVRTPNGIQKAGSATAGSKYYPPRKTAADFF